jgi:hypothetical protein
MQPVAGVLGTSEGDTRTVASTYRKFCRFFVFACLIEILPLASVFAGAQQSGPTAPRQTTTPEAQTPAPVREETKRADKNILATIIQSGSTNTRGYRVVIHKDGSAIAEIRGAATGLRVEPGRSQQFPPGTVDTKTLRRLLKKIRDVSSIPVGSCQKSASFGTRTQIEYANKTSGDLQCMGPQASDGNQALLQTSGDLSRFVQTTLSQLKIDDRRGFEK